MSSKMSRGLGVLFFCVTVLGSGLGSEAATIFSVEDIDIRNDNSGTNGGPTAVNHRSDFFEVRNLTPTMTSTATRKRVGYVKFDISAIDPSVYPTARIQFSFRDNRNGLGVMSVYGLIDNAANADSSFTEANWFSYHNSSGVSAAFTGIPTPPADGLTWSKGLAVDPTILSSNTTGNLGINPLEAALLGVINVPGAVNDMVSNTVDLPLGAFLSADTNGFVTFMLTGTPEWRIRVREADVANSTTLSTALNFAPEPASLALLALGGLLGLAIRRR